MSLPRPVLAGATYLVTRSCTQRQFLLKPSTAVLQVFLYCLAIAARRFGVVVHAAIVMSNHYHLVVTDPHGKIPEFYAWLNEFVARALNRRYGRRENFWAAPEATSRVQLLDSNAVLDKVVYTLTNPVEAGLVSHGNKWPGIRLAGPHKQRIERPRFFFRSNGPLPDEVELVLEVAPVDAPNAKAAAKMIERAVAAREEEIRKQFREEKRKFLGSAAILRQRITDTPTSPAPHGNLSPTVATRNKWLRIEALQRSRAWTTGYAAAMKQWRDGARDVLFPAGTYLMARLHGVAVAPG